MNAMMILVVVTLTVAHFAAFGTGFRVDQQPSADAEPRRSVDDDRMSEMGLFALKEINKRSNSMYLHSLIKMQQTRVEDARGVGTMYHVSFYTGQSSCRKTEAIMRQSPTVERCPLSTDHENAQFQLCKADVLVRLETPDTSKGLASFLCSPVDREEAMEEYNYGNDVVFEDGRAVLGRKNNGDDSVMWPLFRKFLKQYNKTYSSDKETKRRYRIFKINMKIARLLQETETGTAKYGATIFADMTEEEFAATILTPEWKENDNYPARISPLPLDPIPDKWDWREKNVVTPVKNQGLCGSCWAFCTIANIEGVWAIQKGKLVSLSEQQLVDCDKLDSGCSGGLPSNAYKEIIRMGGLETEAEYPYKGWGRKCHNNQTLEQVYINSSLALPKDEQQMAQYLYKNGPLAVGMNANPLMFYMGGVAHPWKFLCSPKSLNHGVTIVGYGVQGDKPYWLVKNSWGQHWGESGYFRLYRGQGVCGIDQMVTSVEIK